jgi:hypothetical protein
MWENQQRLASESLPKIETQRNNETIKGVKQWDGINTTQDGLLLNMSEEEEESREDKIRVEEIKEESLKTNRDPRKEFREVVPPRVEEEIKKPPTK